MYDEYIIESKGNRPKQAIIEENNEIKTYIIKGIDWDLRCKGFLPVQAILQDGRKLMWEGNLKGVPKNAWLSGESVKLLRLSGLC